MGSVELAFQPGQRRFCVVKRALPGGGSSSTSSVERLGREATVLGRLRHRNIARLFGVEGEGEGLLLVQEFIHGRDLAQILAVCASAGVRVPVPVAVHIAREAAMGLDYAYRHQGLGLLHRDLVPENVMVSFGGAVKLVDFGVAVTAIDERLTMPGHVVGRPGYLAPEVLAGGPASHLADVYSLGLVLWELLAGRPFSAVRSAAPRERLAPSAFNRSVPAALDQLTLRAIAWRPEDRFQTAADLEQALRPNAGLSGAEATRRFLGQHYDLAREEALLAVDLERGAGLARLAGQGRGGGFPRTLLFVLLAAAAALAGTFSWVIAHDRVSHAKRAGPTIPALRLSGGGHPPPGPSSPP